MKRSLFVVLSLVAVVAVTAVAADTNPQTNGLVVPQSASAQILIPAAGAVAGANGQFFRSDITILNYASRDQSVQLRWLPFANSGAAIAPRTILLRSRSGLSSEDFVTGVMNQTGLGAILVTAVTADGTTDTTAQLYATARIYSNPPGTESGSVSQSFPTIPVAAINYSRLILLGLKHWSQFRLNVGIVNLDPTRAQTFQITYIGTAGNEGPDVQVVTVQPLSMLQVGAPGTTHTNPQIGVENITATATRSNLWTAYGSSVDNITGDSWSEIGFPTVN